MTQENKELLIRDLSARLSYGVKIELMPITRGKCTTLTPIILRDYFISDDVNYLPYLFPLSSMTLEQRWKVQNLLPENCEISFKNQKITFYDEGTIRLEQLEKVFNFFNLFHLDYRGLIEKGLAIDATNLNIY